MSQIGMRGLRDEASIFLFVGSKYVDDVPNQKSENQLQTRVLKLPMNIIK